MSELLEQIEKAYDYRGHVTIRLKEGDPVEGFVYNRVLKSEKIPDGDYLDLYRKNSEEKVRFHFDQIESIELSGKNHAESYTDFMKRTGGKS